MSWLWGGEETPAAEPEPEEEVVAEEEVAEAEAEEEAEEAEEAPSEKRDEGSIWNWLVDPGGSSDDAESASTAKTSATAQKQDHDIRKLLMDIQEEQDPVSQQGMEAILTGMFQADDIDRVKTQMEQENAKQQRRASRRASAAALQAVAGPNERDGEIQRLLENGTPVMVVEQMYSKEDVQRVQQQLVVGSGGAAVESSTNDPSVTATAEASAAAAAHQIQKQREAEEAAITAALPPEVRKGNADQVDHDALYGPRATPPPDGGGEDKKKDRKKFIPKAERLKTLEATVEDQDLQLQKTLSEMELLTSEKTALEHTISLLEEELREILKALEQGGMYIPKGQVGMPSVPESVPAYNMDASMGNRSMGGQSMSTTGGDPYAKIQKLEKQLEAGRKEREKLLEQISGFKVSQASLKSQLKERNTQIDVMRGKGKGNAELDRLQKVEVEAQETRDALETKLSASEAAAEELRQTVAQLQSENASLQQANETLQQEKQSLEQSTSALTERIIHLESENSNLQSAVETANAEAQQVRDELSIMESNHAQQIQEKESALQEAIDKIAAKEAELESSKAAAEEQVQESNQKLSDVETQLSELQASNAVTEEELQTAQEKIASLAAEVSTLEESNMSLEEKTNRLESELQSTVTELEQANHKVTELEEEKASLQSAHETELADAQASKASLQEELQAANDTLQTLQEENTSLSDAVGNMEADLAQVRDANESLETQLQEANDKIETLQQSDSEALASAQQALAEAEEKVATLESDLSDLQTSKASVEEQLAEANNQVAALQEENAALGPAQEALAESTTRVEELESQLSELQSSHTALEEQLQQANETVASLESNSGDTELALAEAYEQRASLQAEKEEVEQKLAAETSELEIARTDLADATEMVTAYVAELEEAKTAAVATNEKVTTLETELSNLQSAKEEAAETISTLEAQITELQSTKAELDETTEKVQLLESEVAASQTFLAATKEQLEEVQQTLSTAQAEVSDLQVAKTSLEAIVEELQEGSKSLEAEKEMLQMEVSTMASSSAEMESKLQESQDKLLVLEEELVLAKRDAQQAIELKESLEASLQESGRASSTIELEMASLNETIQNLTNQKDALEKEVSNLLTALDEKAAAMEEATNSFAPTLEELAQAKMEVQEKGEANQLLQAELEESRSIEKNLQEELAKLGEGVQEVESREVPGTEESALLASSLEAKEAELTEAKGMISSMENEVVKMREELAAKAETTEKLESTLRETQDNLSSVEEELALAKRDAQQAIELKESLETSMQESGRVSATIELEMGSLNEAIQKLENDKDALEKEVSNLLGALDEKEAELTETKREISSGGDEAATKDKLESMLQENHERLSALEEELVLAKRDAQQANELKESMEASLQESGRASATIELEMASLNETVQNLANDKDALEKEVLDLQNTLAEKETELTDTKEATSSWEATAKEDATTREKLESVVQENQDRLSAMEEELSLAKRDAQQAIELKESLEASLQESGRASATIELEMASLNETVQNLTNQKDALEKQVSDLQNMLGEKETALTETKETVSSLEGEVATAKEEAMAREKLVSMLSAMEEELVLAKRDAQQAIELKESLEASLQETGRASTTLQLEMASLHGTIQGLENDKAALEKEVFTLQGALGEKEAAAEEAMVQTLRDLVQARSEVQLMGEANRLLQTDLEESKSIEKYLQEELSKHQQSMRELHQESIAMKDEISQLAASLDQAKDVARRASEGIESLQNQRNVADKESIAMKDEISQLAASLAQAKDVARRASEGIESLQNQRDVAGKERSLLEASLREKEANLNDMKGALSVLEDQMMGAQKAEKQVSEAKVILEADLAEARSTEAHLRWELTKLGEYMQELQQGSVVLGEDRAKLISSLDSKEREVEKGKSIIAKLELDLKKALAETEEALRAKESAEIVEIALKEMQSSTEETVKSLTLQKDAAANDYAALKASVDLVKAQFQQAKEKVSKLEQSLAKEIQDKIDAVEARKALETSLREHEKVANVSEPRIAESEEAEPSWLDLGWLVNAPPAAEGDLPSGNLPKEEEKARAADVEQVVPGKSKEERLLQAFAAKPTVKKQEENYGEDSDFDVGSYDGTVSEGSSGSIPLNSKKASQPQATELEQAGPSKSKEEQFLQAFAAKPTVKKQEENDGEDSDFDVGSYNGNVSEGSESSIPLKSKKGQPQMAEVEKVAPGKSKDQLLQAFAAPLASKKQADKYGECDIDSDVDVSSYDGSVSEGSNPSAPVNTKKEGPPQVVDAEQVKQVAPSKSKEEQFLQAFAAPPTLKKQEENDGEDSDFDVGSYDGNVSEGSGGSIPLKDKKAGQSQVVEVEQVGPSNTKTKEEKLLQEAAEERSSLKESLREAEAVILQLREVNDTYAAEAKAMIAALGEASCVDATAKSVALEKELELAKQYGQDALLSRRKVETQLSRATATIQTLESDLKQVRQQQPPQVESSTGGARGSKQSVDKSISAVGEAVDSDDEIEKLHNALDAARNLLDDADLEISRLSEDKSRLLNELTSAQEEAEKLKAKRTEFKQLLMDANEKITDLVEERESAQSRLKESEATIRMYYQDTMKLDADLKGARHELGTLKAKREAAKNLLKTANDKIGELVDERNSARSALQDAEDEVERYSAIASQLKADLEEAREGRDTRSSRNIGDDKRHVEELDALKSERDSLKIQLQKQKRKLEDLALSVADAKEKFMEDASASMVSIMSVNEILEADLERLKEEHEEDSEEKKFLRAVLSESKATIDGLKKSLASGNSGNDDNVQKLITTMSRLESAVVEKDNLLFKTTGKLKKLKLNNVNLKENLRQRNKELESAHNETKALQEDAKALYGTQSEHNEYANAERTALVKQIADLEAHLQSAVRGSELAPYDEAADSISSGSRSSAREARLDNRSSENDLLANVAARLKMTGPDGIVRSGYNSENSENDEPPKGASKKAEEGDEKEALLEENDALRDAVTDLENQFVALDEELDALLRGVSPVVIQNQNAEGVDNDHILLSKLAIVAKAAREDRANLQQTSERLEAIVSEKCALERNLASLAHSLENSVAKENNLEQQLDDASEKIACLMEKTQSPVDGSQNRLSDFEMEKKIIMARMAELQQNLERKIHEPEDALMTEDSLAKELHSASQRLQELDVLIQQETGGPGVQPSLFVRSSNVEHELLDQIQELNVTLAERERRIEDLSRALDAAVSENYTLEASAEKARQDHEELLASSSSLNAPNDLPPARKPSFLSKAKNRGKDKGKSKEDSSVLIAQITSLEDDLKINKNKLLAVQERLDSVQKEKFEVEREVDRLVEEKKKSAEARSQLEASLKTSKSSIAVYSNAFGDLEAVIQNAEPNVKESRDEDWTNRTSPESLMKRIAALSDTICKMQDSDNELAETRVMLERVRAEKEGLEKAMELAERSSQKSVQLLAEAGKKLQAMEERIKQTEEERDEMYDRASTLQQVVMRLEEDKENEIYLLNIVMEQLNELGIELPS